MPTSAAAVSIRHSSSARSNARAGRRARRVRPSSADRSASGADAWFRGPSSGGARRTATSSSPSTPTTTSATAPAGTRRHAPSARAGRTANRRHCPPDTTSATGWARAATRCSTSGTGAMARPNASAGDDELGRASPRRRRPRPARPCRGPRGPAAPPTGPGRSRGARRPGPPTAGTPWRRRRRTARRSPPGRWRARGRRASASVLPLFRSAPAPTPRCAPRDEPRRRRAAATLRRLTRLSS